MDFEDEGLYQCEATNTDGQTPKKHQIQVQVQAKPRFKVKLLFTIYLELCLISSLFFVTKRKDVKVQTLKM